MSERVADDFTTIRKRLDEIQREAEEAQRCRCRESEYCPVHPPAMAPEYMGLSPAIKAWWIIENGRISECG